MHGEYKMPGGKLVVADVDVRDGHLANVEISGDFFLEPDSALDSIDAALEGLPASSDEAALAAAIAAALGTGVSMYGVSPEAIAVAAWRALHLDPGA
ncbi:MAG TPA: biotin--protein ligase [Rhodanobacteraceae bacterium]|nr:biotin--protein ligase [Rhodanobacteraceae bacterium]